MLEEYGNTSKDFEFKDDNGYDKIGRIDLTKVQVQILVGDKIEEDWSCGQNIRLILCPTLQLICEKRFIG